jgi:Membrane domain of glycerophosphoryl diester phosphodiesterase
MTTPTLRPLSNGELLDRTFSLYRSHFLLFVGIVAVTNLAYVCLQIAGLAVLPKAAGGPSLSGCGLTLAWYLTTMIVMLAVTAASQGATIVAVSHVYLGREITVTGALAHIRGRITGLAITMIVIGLMTLLGFLALIVPGIILALMWALAIPVAVLEQRTMLDAASRSAELTKGSRLRVLLIYLLFLLLMVIIIMLFSVPITIAGLWMSRGANAAPSMATQMASIIAGFIAQCLTAPLMTIGLSLLYYDQRVRKEAFDLDVMMETIDGQAGAGDLLRA